MSVRIKAFLIHLGISLVVLTALLYVVIFIWYPPPFFAADGGWQGIRIIFSVDLVLGPLLTLMVFNPKKGLNRLRMDMIIIVILQIGSLAAGSWIVADQRTRMVSFANNRFVSMTESQIAESGISDAVYQSLKTQNPPMAFVALPDDPAERQRMVMSNLGGKPLFKRGDLYQPLTEANRQKIVEQGYDLDQVARVEPELRPVVDKLLKKIGKSSNEVSALPLYCRYAILALVMDRKTGELLDTVKISHEALIGSRAYKRLKDKGVIADN